MSMDDFLGHVANKAEMHKMIDEVPEGELAWLIVRSRDEESDKYDLRDLGGADLANTNWMLDCVKTSLFYGE